MKVIHLKAGTRTSLQVHTYKEEANLVLAGRARLHFRFCGAQARRVSWAPES